MQLAYILWTVNPEVLDSLGLDLSFDFRWYGMLFASGFLFGQSIIDYIWKTESKPAKDVEMLTIYALIGTVIGARLGHCLFYDREIYLADPIKILYIWEGGLASHGAAFALILSVWLYSRKRQGQSFLWVIDRVVITVALGGALIRMGNLMNSEIIGKPTDTDSGFVFARSGYDVITKNDLNAKVLNFHITRSNSDTVINNKTLAGLTVHFEVEKGALTDNAIQQMVNGNLANQLVSNSESAPHFTLLQDQLKPVISEAPNAEGNIEASFNIYGIPRYPSQLYESISTFLTFLLLAFIWFRYKDKTPEGLLFSMFVIINFGLRFVYEFTKEPQVEFEKEMTYNMGQLLSIPLVIVGLITLYIVLTRTKKVNQ
jgi:prolipoprotein diacylglyceryltransferase